ncbi:GvpL/GvpF family gas vesicle protein [Streptomyces sp. NPDC057302]|uniref:GvpL/GvpF family gas vesicle protein n=1 Tax=Streptomyces sp. NPDC057302 TaxID=3346094 RepID=UPI003636CCF7
MTTTDGRLLPEAEHPSAAPLVYVYAVARAGSPLEEAAATLGGLGTPPRVLCQDGLAALVADVPADQFSTEALKEQMEDLVRLEAIARGHHHTVEAANRVTSVLPLRMTTVYLDEARVRAMLAERAHGFSRALDLLEGHVELGVKVFADPQSAPPAPEPDEQVTAESPGRSYIQKRRAQRQNQRSVYRGAGTVVARAAEQATELARARVSHRPQQGQLATRQGENLSNDAYLVPAAQAEAFARSVERVAEDTPGVSVEVTGPWVPYSFTEWAEHGDVEQGVGHGR